ncbi:MAG: NADH dehydrogenase FAD-containing subunit [Candidatus Omnitrophica bacterium]|nr:NADH dehydrogenase FAD-containing subunit [Candidatus Omnitrophota bacterium]
MKEKKILDLPYNFNFTVSVLKKVLSLGSDKVIEGLTESGLIGRGGAGFPTGLKWSFVKKFEGERFIICNAEEGEPGTFKDRFLLKKYPYKIIDGMIIASLVLKAHYGFIYLNEKYKEERKIIEKTLAHYKKKNFIGKNILSSGNDFEIKIIESCGRYITGEETSLFNYIEGERPVPRLKPPYPPEKGLWNKPTLINNVETFSFIPQIIYHGSKWFKSFGCEGSYGTKLVCLSGDLVKKGVYEVELGKFTISEILKDFGKIKNLKDVEAVLPSASSGFIFPDKFSLKYDYQTLMKNGTSLGTGGIIVYKKGTNLLQKIKELMKFFMEESCGFCVPCRIGTKRIYEKLTYLESFNEIKNKKIIIEELNLLETLCLTMKESSRCGLGQACVNPLLSWIKRWKK